MFHADYDIMNDYTCTCSCGCRTPTDDYVCHNCKIGMCKVGMIRNQKGVMKWLTSEMLVKTDENVNKNSYAKMLSQYNFVFKR